MELLSQGAHQSHSLNLSAAATLPDPEPTVQARDQSPVPLAPKMLLIPMHHSGSSENGVRLNS